MLIFVHDFKKVRDSGYLWIWIVTVPLQVSPHPEDFPMFSCLHIRRFGNRRFNFFIRITPLGTDFVNEHTLTFNLVRQVNLISDFRGRTADNQETIPGGFNIFELFWCECHKNSSGWQYRNGCDVHWGNLFVKLKFQNRGAPIFEIDIFKISGGMPRPRDTIIPCELSGLIGDAGRIFRNPQKPLPDNASLLLYFKP